MCQPWQKVKTILVLTNIPKHVPSLRGSRARCDHAEPHAQVKRIYDSVFPIVPTVAEIAEAIMASDYAAARMLLAEIAK